MLEARSCYAGTTLHATGSGDGLEADLRVDVNPVVVDHDGWTAKRPDAFIAQVRDQPLVQVPLPLRS